ncbi:MAG: polyprenyl synthetase family protein [Bacteroidetes bacterium]|nr:polyprenyl synthetase family protein [Bacteroidota bacterium]
MSILNLSDNPLDAIREPVKEELKKFDEVFRESMKSRVALVHLITRYIMRQKGKRVRPLLVMLSAKLCGEINDSTYRAATLIELLHTATLVHDDVVDDADTRRGFASINAVWKNKVAVLMGDYLLSRGLLLSLQYNDHYFLNSTSFAVKRMSEGELLQIQKSRQLNIDEDTYIKIISDKTASLFSTCTDIGAASTTEDTDKRNSLKLYGENIGLAFQIRDDLLDYLGRKTIIGKPTGGDIKEKKITLPLIYALNRTGRKEAKQALHMIKKGAKHRDIAWIIDFVRANGGVDYSLKKAEEYAARACECISAFPDSPEKNSLMKFVRFVIERKN